MNISINLRSIITIMLFVCFTNVNARQKTISFTLDSIGKPNDTSFTILITAKVNGHKLRFMLDTGSSSNVVSPRIATLLELKTSEDEIVIEGNKEIIAHRAMAKKMEVGDFFLHKVPFIIAENATGIDSIDQCLRHTEAILGMSFIRHLKICDIDFIHKQIKSLKANEIETNIYNSSTNIRFDDGGTINLRISHVGDTISTILDTGASHSSLGKGYIKANTDKLASYHKDSVYFAGYGGIIAGQEYKIKDFGIMIGSTMITMPMITAFDADYDQRLGMDFFTLLRRMIIDLKNMRVLIYK